MLVCVAGLICVFLTLWVLLASNHFQVVNESAKQFFTSTDCSVLTDKYKRMQCMRPEIEALVLQDSAQASLDYVYTLQNEGVISDCHVPAHWIGAKNLEKYQGDGGQAFMNCAQGCIEGCYHGVIEAYAEYAGTDQIIEMCNSFQSQDSLLYRQCLHGLGHGLMRFEARSVDEAKSMCRSMDDQFKTDTCISGALMEFMDPYIADGIEVFRTYLPTLCEGKDMSSRLSCAGTVGYGAMVVSGHDTTKALELCTLLKENILIQKCKDSVYKEEKLNTEDLNAHFDTRL